jgi:hypothetical protein
MDAPSRWPHYPHNEGTVAFSQRRCKPSAARVPLAASRLQGGAASPFGEEIDCFTPRQILVRVRAVMLSRLRMYPSGGFLRTIVPAREASFAVRTLSGKPLVYGRVLASGKARLFTAPSCTPS